MGGGGEDGNAIKIKLKLNSAWKKCEGRRCVGNIAEDFCVYFVTNFGDVCFGLEGGDNILPRMFTTDCSYVILLSGNAFLANHILFIHGVP